MGGTFEGASLEMLDGEELDITDGTGAGEGIISSTGFDDGPLLGESLGESLGLLLG